MKLSSGEATMSTYSASVSISHELDQLLLDLGAFADEPPTLEVTSRAKRRRPIGYDDDDGGGGGDGYTNSVCGGSIVL